MERACRPFCGLQAGAASREDEDRLLQGCEPIDFLGFQFRVRKTMWREGTKRIFAHSFQPAASPKALTFISRTIRRWTLHHSSDKSLPNLAEMYNPCIRGWINYYSNFYRTQLRSTLKRIDLYVIRWARRKFKRLRLKPKEHATGLIGFAAQIRRSSLIGSCAMETAEHREPCESRGSRTNGAPGVRFLRATRPKRRFAASRPYVRSWGEADMPRYLNRHV